MKNHERGAQITREYAKRVNFVTVIACHRVIEKNNLCVWACDSSSHSWHRASGADMKRLAVIEAVPRACLLGMAAKGRHSRVESAPCGSIEIGGSGPNYIA